VVRAESDAPTAAEIDARLRQLAALSRAAGPAPPLVDMSAAAVADRLLECAEISALALKLEAAGEGLPVHSASKIFETS
jgi:hypothetical protein